MLRSPEILNILKDAELDTRDMLLKYNLHQEAELFKKAYGYVRQYD